MLVEVHFFKASFFLYGNVLKTARKKPTSHVYLAILPLPDLVMPMVNCPPALPPRMLKFHKSPIASTPMAPIPEGVLVPLQVQFHFEKSSRASPLPLALEPRVGMLTIHHMLKCLSLFPNKK